MKQKILYLVLGILIGAVITAGIFLLAKKGDNGSRMRGENMPNFENFDGERPNFNRENMKSKENNEISPTENQIEENV